MQDYITKYYNRIIWKKLFLYSTSVYRTIPPLAASLIFLAKLPAPSLAVPFLLIQEDIHKLICYRVIIFSASNGRPTERKTSEGRSPKGRLYLYSTSRGTNVQCASLGMWYSLGSCSAATMWGQVSLKSFKELDHEWLHLAYKESYRVSGSPYTVVTRLFDVTYRTHISGRIKPKTVHAFRLPKYLGPANYTWDNHRVIASDENVRDVKEWEGSEGDISSLDLSDEGPEAIEL